jgi:hypothetical protein
MMLFAATIGEHALGAFFAAWALVLIAIRFIRSVDDDGEVQKTANEGLAGWIQGWFK